MGKQKNIAIPPIKPLELTKISKGKWTRMNRLLKEGLKQREEEERQLEKERWKTKKEKIGNCLCGGEIVLLITWTREYNPMTGPIIFGPGSRGQFKRVEEQECFCDECGAIYNPLIVQKRKSKK